EAIPPAQVFGSIKPGAGATGVLSTHGTKDGYSGRILAQNVLTNKTIWADDQPDWCYSGTLTTASGLLFVGHNDGSLAAYDASTGKQLWRGQTFPSSADAPAITYSVNGKQYVTILAAGNNHENDPRGDLIETYTLPEGRCRHESQKARALDGRRGDAGTVRRGGRLDGDGDDVSDELQ